MSWSEGLVVVPGPVVVPVVVGGTPVPTPVSQVTINNAGDPETANALAEHEASERPHPNAESGRDFAGWYNALTI